MLAAQLDLMRADVVLRLSDVQRAIDHVGAAEAVLALFGAVPNTDHLPAWDHAGDRRFREEADRSGRDHLVVDVDHQEVWVAAHGPLRHRPPRPGPALTPSA
ncbi:hypothetical protein [Nonomuraea sp. NPDC049758]|uniref:hypothetical protein n=1 Tax=Nonomuraea sp. NPDC049758 TaxID=3154360 RepID=UPI0034481280